MYPVSAAYKTAIAQNVRNTKISGTITLIDDTIINITDEDIALGSLYLTEQCVAGEDIEIGNVYASELGFTLKSPPENPYSLDGARVLINFGIDVGGGVFEYVPLGYFYVTEIERKHTAVNLKALDGMILFDTDLTGVLTGGKPRTIISSCCAKVGITLATDTATFNTFANANVDFALPQGSKVKTCRDLIMWVCQALGCFARMNREGQLEIVPIRAGTSVKTITKAQRFSSDVSDFQVKITKVAMTVGGTEYAQGVDGMTMALEENPLLLNKQGTEINIILANILNQVTQAEYTPYNVKFAGDPAIQAGDWITIPDTSILGGGDVVSLVTHSTWRYRGPHEIRAAGKGAFLRGVTQTQQTKAVSSVVAIATAAQALAQAANQSTQLIKDAIGGHVLIRREPGGTNEILIMDHPDPEQAVKIWRWNMGGLGYSDNVVGADNPDREYTIAMTMDGAINADFVRTGEINTNLVKILGNSNFYWDGDYLYIVNPDDGNQQIRLSKEGIRFTRDGGQTWRVAMDFDGIRMEGQSQDGHTNYTGDGVKVYDEQGNLVGHLGSFEVPSGQTATFTRNSVAYKQDGSQVAANVPRFEQGKFGKAVLVEEGTENRLSASLDFVTGWEFISGASAIVTPGQADPFGGTKAYRIRTTGGTSTTKYLTWVDRPSVDGLPYALQVWVRVPSGAPPVSVSANIGTPVTVTSADGWKKVQISVTGNGSSYIGLLFIAQNASDNLDFYACFPQVENKAYHTSWTSGTRSPETLTIPTAGVLNPQRGEVAILRRMDIASNNPPSGVHRNIFSLKGVIWGIFVPNGTANEIQWAVGSWSSTVRAKTTWDATDWLWIFAEWDLPNATLHVYNVTKGTHASETITNAVSVTVPSSAYVGCADGALFHAHCNGLIDDLRISSRARTDEEILAAYQSGQPLPVDEWTTWKSSFDGHLRNEVPVRKYGLRVIGGEIIAPYIEGGEMYSTSFQTGEKGASDYIKLSSGREPLLVVNGNKEALSIWATERGGFIQFFDPSADDMRGQIWPHDDLDGEGLRVEARNRATGLMDLSLSSANIEMHGNVWVNDNLRVFGDFMVVGSKDAVVPTENYGLRALSVIEMPETKFMDEGVAELINGLCRIDLDPIFLETIEPNTPETPFIVHLTPYDWLTLRVKEIGDTYFIVEEKDGLSGKFAWQLTATRKGYAGERMRRVDDDEGLLTSNWEDELNEFLEQEG